MEGRRARGPRRRAVAIALLALSAGSVAAEWTHPGGGDAGDTSHAPGPGVRHDDVAFSVRLDGFIREDAGGALPGFGTPLIVGDEAWVVARVPSAEQTGFDPVLYRVDLATAAVARIALPRTPVWFVGDPAAFYGEEYGTTFALDPATGEELWSTPPPSLFAAAPTTSACSRLLLHDGALVSGCVQSLKDGMEELGGCCLVGAGPSKAYVHAVDATTGAPLWTWQGALTDAGEPGIFADALAATGDTLVFSVSTLTDRTVNALTAADGAEMWRFAANATRGALQQTGGGVRASFSGASAAASGERIVLRGSSGMANPVEHANEIVRLDADDGSATARAELRDPRTPYPFTPVGLSLATSALYVSTPTRIHRLDAGTLAEEWAVEPVNGIVGWDGVAAADDVLYAATLDPDVAGLLDAGYPFAIEARDPATGAPLWRREFRGEAVWALGAGTLVVLDRAAATVHVLGTTAASIAVEVDATDVYPAPGEEVAVDLSRTRPGTLGPATAFRADWGDGTTTEWQDSPVLRHAYTATGETTARFQARNDAGQTASTFSTFRVGAERPNVVSDAFSPENQERTFFLLGLALTGAGALVGFTRVGAKRRRLARELAAVEKVHADTRHDPPACEAALGERKAHARGLLVDAKLDEAQFAVLERRIDDLARDLRLAALDDRFQYLPLGMVRQLREMLADGRVNTWEREHFEAALERERTMSPEQKANVRALVAEWFERDEGRRA